MLNQTKIKYLIRDQFLWISTNFDIVKFRLEQIKTFAFSKTLKFYQINLIKPDLNIVASIVSMCKDFIRTWIREDSRILANFCTKESMFIDIRGHGFLSKATIVDQSCGLFERKHRVQSW